MKAAKSLIAEERSTFITQAVIDWRKLSMQSAEPLSWGSHPAWWHEQHGYWAFFGKTDANTKLGWRYWHAFGLQPNRPRWHVMCEINPPQGGIARGTQGLFARDGNGQRWILHGGRIHPGDERVDSNLFGKLSGLKPVEVRFSNGNARPYYPVAPLDEGAEAMHKGMAAFVESCAYVRSAVLFGREDADLDRKVAKGEGSSTPEKRGGYVIPARREAEAERVHAEVWSALAAELDKRGIKHSNTRVGRYGPDLRTRNSQPVLFEIKTDTTARAIYEALGQLLLYETLLGKHYAKVLVAPGPPPATLVAAAQPFKIAIVTYRKQGRNYLFDHAAMNSVLSVDG